MAEVDLAVRRSGAAVRLVTNGAFAGLFDRTGLVETLEVTTPATAPMRMPQLALLGGEPLTLMRASKPCSCTGMPWNVKASELRAQVVAPEEVPS